MEIIKIPPKQDMLSAIPKNLYIVEFTAYTLFLKEILVLDDPALIEETLFDLCLCETLVIHSVSHYESLPGMNKTKEKTGYLIKYLMYEEICYYFSKFQNIRRAIDDVKNKVHPKAQILQLNRYRFISTSQKHLIRPFVYVCKYFNSNYLKK